jgi:glutamate N-acetyltransferase/amino-acid N-acetyltransferase
MATLTKGLEQIVEMTCREGHQDFAESILTTDRCVKSAEVKLVIDGKVVTIAGVAKGSGMIHPNMATMLSFITTDAVIDQEQLQSLLWNTTDESFNMITVDGDSSTNDMVVVMASGLAGHAPLTPQHPRWDQFQAAFQYVCQELAKQIARDGEGATRLVQVMVEGARSKKIARQVAKAIVGSNLVKSAVFGADANWGRVLCAAGYGDPLLDPTKVDLFLGEVAVVQNGIAVSYEEEAASRVLEHDPVTIRVCLNQGEVEAVAWGCDLTYEYVRINASYRT